MTVQVTENFETRVDDILEILIKNAFYFLWIAAHKNTTPELKQSYIRSAEKKMAQHDTLAKQCGRV